MTPFEQKLLRCIREFRRLENLTCKEVSEVAACHREADMLLALEPELDDPEARYDAPHRVEHREFVQRLFFR